MKRVLPGVVPRTGSKGPAFDLTNSARLNFGGNGPSFRGFISRVSGLKTYVGSRSNNIVFNKNQVSFLLKSDENFLGCGDYLVFASKDFAKDHLNRTNHLHIVVKYGSDQYKEYTVKSNNLVRDEVSPVIQFIHKEPLFLSKPGGTFIFENPEFLGLDELAKKIENSSSESALGKGIDCFLDCQKGRVFLESIQKVYPDTKMGLKVSLNPSVYKVLHQRLVSDFRQKSDYVLFMDTRTGEKFYKHRDSFEARYPDPYWKGAFSDQDSLDIKKLK